MSTKSHYKRSEIGPGKPGFSKTRSIIEAPFYGNNVTKVTTLKEAYKLAKNSPGTIVTDMPVFIRHLPYPDDKLLTNPVTHHHLPIYFFPYLSFPLLPPPEIESPV